MSPVASRKPRATAAPFAEVLLVVDDADAVPSVQVSQDVACAVGRAVVDDDQFLVDAAELDREHAPDDIPDRLALVEGRHDDGELH